MKFSLEINCDNSAFSFGGDPPHAEVARIIKQLAEKWRWDDPPLDDGGLLRDTNGNQVGFWKFT